MISRHINILKTQSFFLFGARGTGKTTLLSQLFSEQDALLINLLDLQTLRTLQAYPEQLESLTSRAIEREKWILIDEVQKVPELLDVVHHLMVSRRARFALTGSSARKLRRGASNLLAGRAVLHKLFPFTPGELGDRFELLEYLNWGGLPRVYELESAEERKRFLQAYVEAYLQEEIVAEQVIRKLPPFRRFLPIAAQANGTILNYSKIAADIQSDPVSVKNYFQILEDTLLGFFVDPFHLSLRKRQRQSPKFYLFDPGLIRAQALQLDVPLHPGNYTFGRIFESFLINLIRSSLEYKFRQHQLSYLQTKDGAEIDLIIERAGEPTAIIEIKSGETVRDEELSNLNRFQRDIKGSQAVCLYRGALERTVNKVAVLPWNRGLQELGIAD